MKLILTPTGTTAITGTGAKLTGKRALAGPRPAAIRATILTMASEARAAAHRFAPAGHDRPVELATDVVETEPVEPEGVAREPVVQRRPAMSPPTVAF